MFGVILYLYFLFVGFLYANMLYHEKGIFFRSWMGGVFGNVLLMAGIVIPSFLYDFTIKSHIILIVISILPYVFIKLRKKERLFDAGLFRHEGEDCLNKKVFLIAVLPIVLVICILLTNHILVPFKDGGYASGQSTYGDLHMHLGFITSIAEQKSFPPEYPFLAGTPLCYPFFVDMLSSSLYLFGTPLRLAVLIPSYVISLLLVMGFYILAYSLTKKQSTAILAMILFFLGGGLGFSYFIDGAKIDHTLFTRIFTEYYQTPTNLNEMNIRWANPICDMIIPQRTTMAGWFTVIPALWMLTEAIKTKSRKQFIILGLFAGCMPMIHTHSFLALGIISAAMFFLHVPVARQEDGIDMRFSKFKGYIANWLLFGGITIIIALPQLCLWTFKQTMGRDSFLNLHFNWVNEADPYFWFYLKNWGIVALFAIPAIMNASRENKKLLASCGLLFILAELILFQPNSYDNNKLFFIVYMILLIIVSDWFVYMWDKLKGVSGRMYLSVILIIVGLTSGVLTICREWYSGGKFQVYKESDIKVSNFIKENTDPNSVFLTATNHTNPVVSLAGRSIYLGSSLYVYFHGMGDEMYERQSNLEQVYTSGNPEFVSKFVEDNNIDYIFVGDYERSEFDIDDNSFVGLEKVYDADNNIIYKAR